MSRMTNKRQKALEVALAWMPNPDHLVSEILYAELEKQGFYWHSRDQEWRTDPPLPQLYFATEDGTPTQHFKIRVMAHPDLLPELAKRIEAAINAYGTDEITRVVTGVLLNKQGAGARIYLEGQIHVEPDGEIGEIPF